MAANLFYPFILVCIVPVFSNVLFLPRGQIFASYDHWTLHFPIQTQTSWRHIEKLDHRVRMFKTKFANRFAEHRQTLRSDMTNRIWGKFLRESDLLDIEINVTMSVLQHLKPSRPARNARSLLPFVGDAMSSLFGTVTTSEIQDVLSRVNALSDSQFDVLNVIDNTVTMINQTVIDVDMNRQTINRLNNITNHLTERLSLLTDIVADDYIASVLEYDMDSVFSDLVSSVRDFRKSITNMETILSLAENGILPRSLLPPSRFAKILSDIQKSLPRDLALPFASSDTDLYYSTSHSQTVRTAVGISVLVTIPLLSIRDHFNVFQVFNIPVPKSANDQKFVANYEIENAKFVALSEDSLKFIFVDDNDIQLYLRRKLPFCPIRRPIMNVLTSKMCLPALLTNRTDNIDHFCEKVIFVNKSADPTAEYVGNGHWIVVSTDPVDLEIRCKNGSVVNSTSVVRTVAPLSLVKLDFGCTAFNNHFQLPTHFRTDSYLQPYQIRYLNQTLTANDIWNHVTSSFSDDGTFNEALTSLSPVHMKAVTLSALKQRIAILKSKARHFNTVTVPAISVTTTVFLVVCVLFILRCARTRCLTSLFRILPKRSSPQTPTDGPTVEDDLTDPTQRRSADLTCQEKSTVPTAPDHSAKQSTLNPGTSLSLSQLADNSELTPAHHLQAPYHRVGKWASPAPSPEGP